MGTLSQYWFRDRFFGGTFDGFNQPFPDGGWVWISNTGGSKATLLWNRPDNESTIDVGAQLNTPIVLGAIDSILGSQASRTSGIRAAGVFCQLCPTALKILADTTSGTC